MKHPIEPTDEVVAALYDPSPLDQPGVIGIWLDKKLSFQIRRLVCLYETEDGCYARRGERDFMGSGDNMTLCAVWTGTIRIPKYNYDKYTGKLKKLGIFEANDYTTDGEYLDSCIYELHAKSNSRENRAKWVIPDLDSQERLLKEMDRLLMLPQERFEKISRFDRILIWLQRFNGKAKLQSSS